MSVVFFSVLEMFFVVEVASTTMQKCSGELPFSIPEKEDILRIPWVRCQLLFKKLEGIRLRCKCRQTG
ncbi:MAG TPA: hypothetical protein VL098_06865 [Flavipsychrobacter sp.]|nr:hypothetical protein [Flavipsychrobacter sp.]